MFKILIAYDGTDAAKAALGRAAIIPADGYTVVSVAPTTASGGRSAGAIDPVDGVDVHREEAAEAQRLLQEKGITADLVIAVGDPGQPGPAGIGVQLPQVPRRADPHPQPGAGVQRGRSRSLVAHAGTH